MAGVITDGPSQTLRSARYFAYDAEGGLLSRRSGELVEERNRPLQFRQARKEENGFTNFNPVPALIKADEWTAMTAGEREYWAGAVNTRRYAFANGQLLGSVSEAGQMAVGDRLSGFENSSLGTSTVVVRSGETLRNVAQRVYGDGSLWYVLADANGLQNSDETLAEGQNLQVPQLSTTRNSASTFRPYDPSEQIGPTAPSLPTIAPPPKNSCNPIAQLLMVIVAVVVTIYTAGAAATVMAGGSAAVGNATVMAVGQAALTGGGTLLVGSSGAMIAAGASLIGGAVGSIASQAVGIATGQQQGFSWRGVAAGALGAGITSGIGGLMGNVGTAVQGAMGGTGTWGNVVRIAGAQALGGAAANVLTGGSFSWRQVVASAVGSVASSAATNAMFGTVQLPGGTGGILSDTATGFVGGIVSAHTRKAFGVGGVNESRIALDAFGNAVANAMVRSAEDQQRMREAAEVEAQVRRDRVMRNTRQPNSLLTFDPRIGRPLDANGDGVHDASDSKIMDLGFMSLHAGPEGMSWRSFGLSGGDIRRIPGLVDAYADGFRDTTAGALARATRWALSEFGALSSGEYQDSDLAAGFAQFSAFAYSELEAATSDGLGRTRTARFIAESGQTAAYYSENPELLVYGLLDSASEWWESRTPEQRAYGAGQISGGVALGILADRGLGAIARLPSALESLRFGLVDRFPSVARLESLAVQRIEAAAARRAGAAATAHVQELMFDSLRDFNRALHQAKPNTRYVFDGHSLTTDALARLRGVEVPKPGVRPMTELGERLLLADRLSRSARIVEADIPWGADIRTLGRAYEDASVGQPGIGPMLSRDPDSYGFDFFNPRTRHASSLKALDNLTDSRLRNPRQIYSTLSRYVDDTINFRGDPRTGLSARDIASTDLRVLLRGEPTAAQWLNIARAHEMAGMPGNDIRLLIEIHRRTRG